MKILLRSTFSVTLALLATNTFAQKANSHVDGIEFQMRQDEQALVMRTYENAKSFHAAAKKEISALDKKISKSSGNQLIARKARREKIKTMDQMINGCLIDKWHKLEDQRAGSAEYIDQLIQSFQSSLQE
jgi:hypothetical protein